MDARNCCKTMEMELTVWKAMIYDIIRKMEQLSGGAKENVLSDMQDMYALVDDMDKRIEQIREKCSPETGIEAVQPERRKFVGDIDSLRSKVDDAMKVLSSG
jgi:hypothetical protein